jgi:hypothetical protein
MPENRLAAVCRARTCMNLAEVTAAVATSIFAADVGVPENKSVAVGESHCSAIELDRPSLSGHRTRTCNHMK